MSTHSFLAQVFARDPRFLARFPEPPLTHALEELQQIEQLRTRLATAPTPSPALEPVAALPTPESAAEPLSPTLLAALATNVWRTKAKLTAPATGVPYDDARRAMRHVEGALEGFSQLQLVIKDYNNEAFDPGMPLKVLAYQPTPGIERDTVVEVLKPTIIWQDKVLQLGEVVVGTPENSAP